MRNPGYCKACRKHGKQVHYLDREPGTNYIIRGAHARAGNPKDIYEASGICQDCEAQTLATRDELLEASKMWGRNAVHDTIIIDEYLNTLPDNERYDAETLIANAPAGLQLSEDRRASLTGLVVAVARMRYSDGTPKDKREAARSIFIPFYERVGHQDLIRKEFSEKWQLF